MSRDENLRLRPGPPKKGDTRVQGFLGQALAAAHKAGGPARSANGRGWFGRGRVAALRTGVPSGRRVVVKARVVRMARVGGGLGPHLAYLKRDGVDRSGAPGRLFDALDDAEGGGVDGVAFADRCADDRHHFRFIVAPEDAAELADLRVFTRELMAQAEVDLGTRLDWVAVDHWNTAHPHVHILVRGRADDGADLVIARDYIREGLRDRGERLVNLELGPRSEREIASALDRDVQAPGWTRLDQALVRDQIRGDGVIDLRPDPDRPGTDLATRAKRARLDRLAALGLADQTRAGRWTVAPAAEPTLRALAREAVVAERLHKALPAPGDRILAPGSGERDTPVMGRLLARGLDDELKGTAYAVVDGVDGRLHHIALPDLTAASDAPVGAVVERRLLPGVEGRPPRPILAVRSDLDLAAQVGAEGATWLDRRLVARDTGGLAATGFGREVAEAVDRRRDHLRAQGLITGQGAATRVAPDLIATLRARELASTATRLAAETGLPHRPAAEGETVSGVVRRRLDLASGRFAMIDDGLGFQLVPWASTLERDLGRSVRGVVGPGGGVDWRAGRGRGPGR
ncbi:type VI secretion protein [Brevundimonas sp. LM2]|uniref:DUF3363 domain-containing protein n=1 Tax=Brevundimonas sp. LM2 TaxID=1938605 RepID=UPI000983E0BF|nr:DUF3363 domain-containing protein [Brevundimonas sp. LM2]AQR61690.1 type VI secretion protein [Brevundimonas sp. LM2]